jgi:hypothetical protein
MVHPKPRVFICPVSKHLNSHRRTFLLTASARKSRSFTHSIYENRRVTMLVAFSPPECPTSASRRTSHCFSAPSQRAELAHQRILLDLSCICAAVARITSRTMSLRLMEGRIDLGGEDGGRLTTRRCEERTAKTKIERSDSVLVVSQYIKRDQASRLPFFSPYVVLQSGCLQTRRMSLDPLPSCLHLMTRTPPLHHSLRAHVPAGPIWTRRNP